MNDLILFGTIVQAGNDIETGKPRIIIETTEAQLRDIRSNILFKPCRVEMMEATSAAVPNVRGKPTGGDQ